jgi:hypothetical protein
MGARWYDPALGRFTQPDSIIPVAAQGIQAWDRYAYVNNNPIIYRDLSGHCTSDDYACVNYLFTIQNTYAVKIIDDDSFTWDKLQAIQKGMDLMQNSMGVDHFVREFKGVTFGIVDSKKDKDGKEEKILYTTGNRDVNIHKDAESDDYMVLGTIHELAHIWDNNYDDALSNALRSYTRGRITSTGKYSPGGHPARDNGYLSPGEDWADTVAIVVNYYPAINAEWIGNPEFYTDKRMDYVKLFFNQPPSSFAP